MIRRILFGLGMAVMAAPVYAGANYKAIMLHSELVPGSGSRAVGISAGQQVGFSDNIRALLWNGSAQSFVNLHPDGYASSGALGVQGGKQIGNAYHAGLDQVHPLIWNGSANDYVNLYAPNVGGWNFQDNFVRGIGGDQQVGIGIDYVAGRDFAILWHGTAASATLLHPEGFLGTWADATDGVQQVGYGSYWPGQGLPGGYRALLWHGTAESFVDLTPDIPLVNAFAHGVGGGQQVGQLGAPGFPPRKLLCGPAAQRVSSA